MGTQAGIDSMAWLQHAWRNRLQSLVLLGAMGGFLASLGWLLWGVLAHEISHIRNNDLWVMGLADMFGRATNVLSLMGQFLLFLNMPLILFAEAAINWFAILLLIFAPSIRALAQLAMSRTREYDANLNAARLTGDPEGLARPGKDRTSPGRLAGMYPHAWAPHPRAFAASYSPAHARAHRASDDAQAAVGHRRPIWGIGPRAGFHDGSWKTCAPIANLAYKWTLVLRRSQ